MMRTTTWLTLGMLLAACSGGETTAPGTETPTEVAADPATDKAAKVAAISLEIKADPDGYEAILTKHGMTSAEFEIALYEIAADPALTARYEAEFPSR
jgi:hypothetical protein